MMVLGKADIRTDNDALYNFGTTAGKPMYRPQDLSGASNTTGSVLNQKGWWPMQNDAWLLGGAHGGRQFHLAKNDLTDADLWDAKSNRPTVLGREILAPVLDTPVPTI
ncbi:hypothetical protein [Archangium lipolyticum]|uniref:hypothetical protein n=1 Tax=Archangium lipolyticum TaxID=2970465 RepID=UPI002149DE67|nr:hypothetical protein [Archangium lipolyticum]